MNKIKSFLLLIASVLVIGTVSSCKDTDSDSYNNLNSKYLTLDQALKQQKTDLQEQIDALKAHIANCKCEERYAEVKGLINDINGKINDINDKIGTLNENKADKTAVTAQIEAAKNELQVKIDELKNRLDNLKIPAECNCADKWNELLTATIPSIKSDITALSNALTTMETTLNNKIDGKVDIAAFNTAIEAANNAIEAAKNEFQTQINGIISDINLIKQEKASVEQLNSAVNILDAAINNVKIDVNAVKEDLGLVKEDISGVKVELNDLLEYVNAYVGSVIGRLEYFAGGEESIETIIDGLNNSVNVLNTTIGTVQTELGEVKGKAEANETWISSMKEVYGDDLKGIVAGLATEKDLNKVKDDVTTVATNVDNLTQQYNELLVTLEETVDGLQADYAERDETLRQQIFAVKEDLGALTTRVETLETQMKEVSGLAKAIANRLNSQITSIVVQSVTTPLFLDVNLALPVNVQSNVICAYYGSVQNGEAVFPSSDASMNLSAPSERLTDDEIAEFDIDETTLPQGTTLQSTGGKIYLTINPSDVNFTGAGLKLVDSQNGNSGFELTNVKKSDKLLSFVGRSADNGFYEADVTLVDKEKAQFNTAPLKEAAKQVYSSLKSRSDIREMVKTVLRAAYSSVHLPAYAVQAPYTWTDEKGVEKTSYVHSNYNIAATAVHPLTYNLSTQIDNFATKIPHKMLHQIPYISDKLINSGSWKAIKTKLYFEFDKVEYRETIEVSLRDIHFKEGTDYVLVELTYQKPEVDPVTGETTYTVETMEVKITEQDANDMINKINDALKEDIIKKANKKIKNIQVDFVNAINEALENTEDMINERGNEIVDILESFSHKSDKYVDRVNSLIDKINNQLEKVYARLDCASYYLMPIMFYGDSQYRLQHLSAYENGASYVNAGHMVLYPTSYTAEILNPAAKKMVKVTKAKNLKTGENDLAAVKRANDSYEDLNKVVAGTVRAIGVKLESGYAYEFAYSALDYTGYQVTQRYWIKVK